MGLVIRNGRVECFAESIGVDLATSGTRNAHQRLIFTANHATAIFRHERHEIAEELIDLIEVFVVIKMVGLDVRDEHRARRDG